MGFVALVADVEERVQMQEKLKAAIAVRDEFLSRAEQQLRALAGHIQTVREDERAELAREIHDVLGQDLTGLKMDAAWLVRRLAQGETVSSAQRGLLLSRLESMLVQMDASIVNARRIATRLRPGLLDNLGLVAALEWQCREFQDRPGIAVRWCGPAGGACHRIRRARRRSSGSRRSSSPTSPGTRGPGTRRSSWPPKAARADARGAGRWPGHHPAGSAGRPLLGLLGIRERALAAGGDCVIEGTAGQGTSVCLRIPWPAAEAR